MRLRQSLEKHINLGRNIRGPILNNVWTLSHKKSPYFSYVLVWLHIFTYEYLIKYIWIDLNFTREYK